MFEGSNNFRFIISGCLVSKEAISPGALFWSLDTWGVKLHPDFVFSRKLEPFVWLCVDGVDSLNIMQTSDSVFVA